MKLEINGKPHESLDCETLEELVRRIVGEGSLVGVAVAVNDEIVPRVQWKEARLAPDSRVEILRAVAGG